MPYASQMAVTKGPAGKPRRREDPSVRKAQILSAARTCFADSGFKATTVDDIAGEAGVSVGLLYRIFGSKTAIVEAIILEQVEAQIAQAFDIISASTGIGIDRKKALRNFEGSALDLKQLALTFEMAAEACRNKRLREFMQNRRTELYSEVIERLTASGMDRNMAEKKFAELDLIGAIGSGAVIQSLSSREISVSHTVETVFQSMDRGSRTRADKQ
jgi:AcrR family transcriptional regulator